VAGDLGVDVTASRAVSISVILLFPLQTLLAVEGTSFGGVGDGLRDLLKEFGTDLGGAYVLKEG
jgi:hypothetical protein